MIVIVHLGLMRQFFLLIQIHMRGVVHLSLSEQIDRRWHFFPLLSSAI